MAISCGPETENRRKIIGKFSVSFGGKKAFILQGTKIYGVHLHPIPIPARERDVRKDHENFFFNQQDYVSEMGAQHGFNYTALRP
jgi:hypothetical protein